VGEDTVEAVGEDTAAAETAVADPASLVSTPFFLNA